MPKYLSIIFGLAALITSVPAPAAAQKTTATASYSANLPDADLVIATATIAKGKPKRVLVATAAGDPSPCDLKLRLLANGLSMDTIDPGVDGYHGKVSCDCSEDTCPGCVATVVTFLDVAEAANPGMFKNQTIDVDLVVDANGDRADAQGQATLVVEMKKK